MDISSLAAVIFVLCRIESKDFTEYQSNCVDHYNNCMIKYDKDIDPKRLPYCEGEWRKKSLDK